MRRRAFVVGLLALPGVAWAGRWPELVQPVATVDELAERADAFGDLTDLLAAEIGDDWAHPTARFVAGLQARAAGETEAAREHFNTVPTRHWCHPAAKMELSDLYLEAGKLKSSVKNARDAWREADLAEFENDHQWADIELEAERSLMRIGAIYAGLDRHDEALRYWAQVPSEAIVTPDALLCRQALGHDVELEHPESDWIRGDRSGLEAVLSELSRGEVPAALEYRFRLDRTWRHHRRRVEILEGIKVKRSTEASARSLLQAELARHRGYLGERTAALVAEQRARVQRMLASGAWERLWVPLET